MVVGHDLMLGRGRADGWSDGALTLCFLSNVEFERGQCFFQLLCTVLYCKCVCVCECVCVRMCMSECVCV